MDDFDRQKIVYAETMRVHKGVEADRFPRFSFDENAYFTDKTCFTITGDNLKYILAVINSNVAKYFIKNNVAVLDNGGFLMQKIYVEQFPIPRIDSNKMASLEVLLDQTIDTRKHNADTAEIESRIDDIVYALFEFTEEEIALIESYL